MSPIKLDRSQVARFYSAAAPGIKQQGEEWRGPCPLHKGTRDSFSINASSGAWHCHSNCAKGGSPEDFIMERDGLSSYGQAAQRLRDDLGIPREDRREPKADKGRIVATYDYTDERGNLLYQVVRLDPKSFRQRRPDPARPGQWVWSMKGQRLVPYNLPAVRTATSTVYIVEGEKDVEALARVGVVATCNPMGAGKWRAEYAGFFAGLDVAVIPDNDDAGRDHARMVAESLTGSARSVKLLDLPGLPAKGDVCDWLAGGGTFAQLDVITNTAPVFGTPAAAPARGKYHLYTIGELADLPPLEWLIEDRVPAGAFAVVFGPSGGGKSFMTLDMALSIATGIDWDGQEVKPGPVIYATGEGLLGIGKRIAAWCHARQVARDSIDQFWLMAECPALLDGGDVGKFLGSIGTLPVKPDLLVIDTLARAIVGGDENSAQDMGRAVAAIDHIKNATGATIILVHHTSKARPDQERGSGALRGASDTMVLVSPDDAKKITFSCEKQKDAAPFDTSAWRLRVVEEVDSCIPERLDEAPAKRKGKGDRITPTDLDILEIIRRESVQNGGATLSEIARLTGENKSTVSRSRNRLRNAGYLNHDTVSGKYSAGSFHPFRSVPFNEVDRSVPFHTPLGGGTGGTAERLEQDPNVKISMIPHETLPPWEGDGEEIVL